MIDEVDRRIMDWVSTILDGVKVFLSEPGLRAAEHTGVSVYLLEMVENHPPRTTSRPPLQVSLIYLLTTWSPNPEEAHRWLGRLLFAAMENDQFQVDLSPLPPEVWTGFSVPPRPGFKIKAPCRLSRRQERAKHVLHPLVVKQSPIKPLQGIVLGPGDVPVMGARVEILGLGQHTRTDARGKFYFARVPTDPPPAFIEIKARGQDLRVTPSSGWIADDEPLLIRFPLKEV